MTATKQLQDRYAAAIMLTYGMPPVALARGDGCVVWDVDGNSYLDLVGGIAVSALGHAHPGSSRPSPSRPAAWCTPPTSTCTSRRCCSPSG